MKLVHFEVQKQFHFGMINATNEYIDLDTACRDFFGVNPVKGADPSRFRDMRAFFAGGTDSVVLTRKIEEYIEKRRAKGWTPRAATGARYLFHGEEGVSLLAPVVPSAKIYCLAHNSLSHLAEQKKSHPLQPYFFTRYSNSLVGPGEPLLLHAAGSVPDVELELAAVIGKRGKHISSDHAMEYVAGYTIALDMAYRDLQFPSEGSTDWVMGKGFDATMAVGPWIVPREEVGDATNLVMNLTVNDVNWQRGTSADYLFRVPTILEHLSRGITLEPGDVISLGTLGGLPGFEFGSLQRRLKAGDKIDGQIEKIGSLTVPVMIESSRYPTEV